MPPYSPPVREEPDSKCRDGCKVLDNLRLWQLPVRESLAGKQKNRTVLCHMSLTCPLTYYQSKACKTFLLRQMGLLQEEGKGTVGRRLLDDDLFAATDVEPGCGWLGFQTLSAEGVPGVVVGGVGREGGDGIGVGRDGDAVDEQGIVAHLGCTASADQIAATDGVDIDVGLLGDVVADVCLPACVLAGVGGRAAQADTHGELKLCAEDAGVDGDGALAGAYLEDDAVEVVANGIAAGFAAAHLRHVGGARDDEARGDVAAAT